MATVVAILATVLFSVWVIATLAAHWSDSWAVAIGRFDPFALVPTWKFFAPNPGTTDYHLVFRDRLASGELTPFREVPALNPARDLFAWAWYPRRRLCKAVTDAVVNLLRDAERAEPGEPGLYKLTVAYLTLANYVSGLPASAEAQSRQFLILASFGYEEALGPILVFTSDFHALTAR
jgi:hypothetical protein